MSLVESSLVHGVLQLDLGTKAANRKASVHAGEPKACRSMPIEQ